MQSLGMRPPTAVVRVTEHMDEIRQYVAGILDRGMGYTAPDGVYFDVQAFSKS
jgi:cysteinyl-tRNA synthetase